MICFTRTRKRATRKIAAIRQCLLVTLDHKIYPQLEMIFTHCVEIHHLFPLIIRAAARGAAIASFPLNISSRLELQYSTGLRIMSHYYQWNKMSSPLSHTTKPELKKIINFLNLSDLYFFPAIEQK